MMMEAPVTPIMPLSTGRRLYISRDVRGTAHLRKAGGSGGSYRHQNNIALVDQRAALGEGFIDSVVI